MSNILITGGAGFIGSHLAHSYQDDGHRVIVIDNLSTGRIENLRRDSNDIKPIQFIKEDIGKCDLVSLFGIYGIEIVHHIAARPRVKFSVDFPLETNEENATNTLKVLDACKKAGVRRLVNTSSSSIYGEPTMFPTPEHDSKVPQSPYALQKWIGEEYCRLYAELFGFDVVSLRYFNVFGPRSLAESEYSAVIPIWIEQIVSGLPVTIDGTGEQSRDFTDVANVVHANKLAAFTDSKLSGQGINIACDCCYSLHDVLDRLDKLIGIPHTKEYRPSRPGDVFKTHATIQAAKDLIGYEPVIDFDEGMKKYVDWYLAYLEEKDEQEGKDTILPQRG